MLREYDYLVTSDAGREIREAFLAQRADYVSVPEYPSASGAESLLRACGLSFSYVNRPHYELEGVNIPAEPPSEAMGKVLMTLLPPGLQARVAALADPSEAERLREMGIVPDRDADSVRTGLDLLRFLDESGI
jgi:hypothetical protein